VVAGQDRWAALKTKLAVFQLSELSGSFLFTRYSTYIPESNFSFFFLFLYSQSKGNVAAWYSAPQFAHMQYRRRNAVEVH